MSQSTIAAARQNEMKTSIAVVTTMIWGRPVAAGTGRGAGRGESTAIKRRAGSGGRAPRVRATRRAARSPTVLRRAAPDSAHRSAGAAPAPAASDGCVAAQRRRRGGGGALSAARPRRRKKFQRSSVPGRRAGPTGRRAGRAGWRRRSRARWSIAAPARARLLPDCECRREGELARCGRRERSEEHTSELQSRENLVCCLLLEKKKWLVFFGGRIFVPCRC